MSLSFLFTSLTCLNYGQLMAFKPESALVNGTCGLDFVTINDDFLSSKCTLKYVGLLFLSNTHSSKEKCYFYEQKFCERFLDHGILRKLVFSLLQNFRQIGHRIET